MLRKLATLNHNFFRAAFLFAALAIALASDFPPPGTPRANEMEDTHPLV